MARLGEQQVVYRAIRCASLKERAEGVSGVQRGNRGEKRGGAKYVSLINYKYQIIYFLIATLLESLISCSYKILLLTLLILI